MTTTEAGDPRSELRKTYAALAEGGADGAGCCSPRPATPGGSGNEVDERPGDSVGPGLGCGDPVALAGLRPGQRVLDLGSGGGLDCFRAAEQVGADGRVIGVDMTPEMIARARTNLARMGVGNVEFRLGEIEHLPLADDSVDVVISNCVMNLSPDKDRAFREAYRVLRPGGTVALCDVLMDAPLPEAVIEALGDDGACLGSALHEGDYVTAMERAGFVDIHVEREYLQPIQQENRPREGRARVIVQIGETGETVGTVELGPDVDLGALPRSFNAEITARKPLKA